MLNKVFHYIGIVSCILLIIACFMPWTYYPGPKITFTGFNVQTFPSGVNYGKAGIPIVFLTVIILILTLLKSIVSKRINLFLCALLMAFAIRTFVVFSGSLIKGDLIIKPALFLVIILPFFILLSAIFPKDGRTKVR